MTTIAATEAKAHLSAILDRVTRGEEFELTRRGKRSVYLGPKERTTQNQAQAALAEILVLRAKITAKGSILEPGETIKSLISKGRS